jgi:hypothetical protein
LQIQKDLFPGDGKDDIPGAAHLLCAALPLMAALKPTPLYTSLTTAAQLQPKNLRCSAAATASTKEIMADDFASFIFNAKQSVAAIDLAVTIQQELASVAGSTAVASLRGAENVRRIVVRGVEAAAELCLPLKMMVPRVWRPDQGREGLEAMMQQVIAVRSGDADQPMHRTLEDLRRHGMPLMQVGCGTGVSKPLISCKGSKGATTFAVGTAHARGSSHCLTCHIQGQR